MTKRFQRPISNYDGSVDLQYRKKYQEDSQSVPKVAISSAKMDGDFNYLVDAVNTLDEDIKSVVATGVATGSVYNHHLADNSVTGAKIVSDSIESKHLKIASVTEEKVADLSVSTTKLANNAVTKDKMASSSVGTDEIINASVTKDKLAPDAISDSVPVGTVAIFKAGLLPTGWLLCDGAVVSKDTYPQLVRFLTGSDVELSSTIPNIPADVEKNIHYGIKAFSDTLELANVEIAGLTQDVSSNKAEIANRALKKTAPIAECFIASNGTFQYGYGVKSISRTNVGAYSIFVLDEFKDLELRYIAKSKGSTYAPYFQDPIVGNGHISFGVRDINTGAAIDADVFVRVFKVQE